MRVIWTESRWSREELDGKTVEFVIPVRGGTVHGLGTFLVRRNPERLLAIDATTDIQGQDWAERIFTRYHLTQTAVDRIEKHPDQSVAVFRLA